jgi:hypothetical protein
MRQWVRKAASKGDLPKSTFLTIGIHDASSAGSISVSLSAKNGTVYSTEPKMVKWEYQIVRADTVENLRSAPNKLGSEGWEATSGGYVTGESKRSPLGRECRFLRRSVLQRGPLSWSGQFPISTKRSE